MADVKKTGSPLSLEHLIALNDEIAAMVRAGVPLDQGLMAAGGDLPGRLGRLTNEVAVALGRGASLVEVIESDRVAAPGAYRAVVSAGLRSGRLSGALESVAGPLRRLAESRREAASALIYPLIVAMVAWSVGYLILTLTWPSIESALHGRTLEPSPLAGWLSFAAAAWRWVGAALILLIVVLAILLVRSGRATFTADGRAATVLGRMPWLGAMLRASRIAAFVDVLALLVENEVPLEQGVVLAAEATGQPRMIRSARELSASLEAGRPLDASKLRELNLPPMLVWMISSGLRRGELAPSLRHASKTYHRRAEHAAAMARIFLPVIFSLAFGGVIAATSLAMLFIPYYSMLQDFSKAL